MPHRYAHRRETPTPRENCYAVCSACFIPLYHPVTTLPHRCKCGFEDHWTLNLLNTSPLWKHLCTETVLSNYGIQCSIAHNTSHLHVSCMFSSTIKETCFQNASISRLCFYEMGCKTCIKHFSNFPEIKYAHGHADQGTKVPKPEK